MFHFKLLGTAAGGGIPQWNCSCRICALSRQHPEIVPPRLQLQASISGAGNQWILLNASPDLRSQIESNEELQSSPANGERNTPIEAIILTGAELDQVLGLLLMREFQPLIVYATPLVRETLEANSFFNMMHRVPNQLTWVDMTPGTTFYVGDSGIACTPIPLAGGLPSYAPKSNAGIVGEASVGLLLEGGGKRVAYTPVVPAITAELKAIYESCDVVLMDGSFWSDGELIGTHRGTPLATDIGHLPLSGAAGTIELMADVTSPEKIFIHINNTNPILDPRSAEHAAVLQAGWQIGYDGWELRCE